MYRLALILALLPSLALADEVLVKGLDPAKEYKLARGADGKWVASALDSITAGGAPNPNPPPPPPPVPTLASKAKALTQEAVVSGGTQSTAVALSAVYSLVSDQTTAGNVPHDQAMTAIKFLSDQVIPTAESAKWAKFRTGVGVMVAEEQANGRFGTKAQVAAGLKSISDGIKSGVEATAQPGEAIDWQALFKLLLPILLKLLEKWLGGVEM